MTHRLGAVFGPRINVASVPSVVPSIVTCPPVPDLRMDGNNQWGDCTVAGVDHISAVWNARDPNNLLKRLTQEQLESVYFSLTGGPDTGLPEQAVIKAWEDTCDFGYKLPSATQIHPADIRAAIAREGVVYLGVVLPESAETQFASGEPWTVVQSSIAGGHCVVGCAYDEDWLTVVTWGAMQKVSWEWWATYAMEAWQVVRP